MIIESQDVKVTEAALEEKPILRQLLELYQYDFSEFEGTDLGPHGFYGYRYLDHYWTEPERHPYLIRVNGQIAGFVLVNRHGVSGEDRWSVAEFFVMRKYRGRGMGEFAATSIFDLWPGPWEVMQVASHPDSTAFWRKVIGRYTDDRFEERPGPGGSPKNLVQLFDNASYARSRKEAPIESGKSDHSAGRVQRGQEHARDGAPEDPRGMLVAPPGRHHHRNDP